MMCIYQIYEDEKKRRLVSSESTWFAGATPEKAMSILHEFAKTIVTYAGLNRFFMPGDIYSQLVKIEVQMT